MSFKLSWAAIAVTVFLTSTLGAQTNLIVNGSFETPPVAAGSYVLYNAGQSFSGWTVVGPPNTNITLSSGTYTERQLNFPAEDEQDFVDLTGGTNQAEGVQQVVTTVAGTGYNLSFWIGNLIDTTYNLYGTTSTVNVFVNGVQVPATFTNSAGAGSNTMNWQQFNFQFVANTTSTTLTFINGDPSTDNINGLDNVVLTVASLSGPLTLSGSVLFGLSNNAVTGPPPCVAGDPVICATGNFVETATDLTVRGRGRFLNLVRTYNAQDAAAAAPGAAGFGWTHSYAESLSFDGSGHATVRQGNGSTVTFTASGSLFTTSPFVIATLVKNTDGTYTFTLPDQTAEIFSSSGRLLAQTDRNAYQTSLTYDGSGNLVSVMDPAGRMLSFSYGSNGLVSSVADPIGRSVVYVYDASNNLIAVTDAGGSVTRYAYDGTHRLTGITDPNGGITANIYDANNRVISQTDPAGRTTTFAYSGTTTTITDGNGHVENQTYTDNRLTSITRGVGTAAAATSTFGYDAAGNRISATDPNGHIWSSTYDARGNQLTSTDPLGRTITSTYDGQNNLLTQTDPLGVTTTNTYDAHGNRVTTSRPVNGTTQTSTARFQHGDTSHPGDVTAMVDSLGQTWARTYDANGYLVQRLDPDHGTWAGSYNGVGWLTSEVTPRGQGPGANPVNFTITQVYSLRGELVSSTDQLGHVTTFTYDGNQNRVSATDALGNATKFSFDPDNEPVKVTRADGSIWTTAFDAAGNVIGQTDGLGRTTSYAYDALNRPVQITDPLGRQTNYVYDGAGNRTKIIDAAGQTTAFAYDAANQLTGISYSDGKTPAVSFVYDADGQRTGMTDGTGTTTYQYDSLNRLTMSKDGAGNQVSYSYDLRGDLTRLTYPSGKQVSRGFDDAGRLTSLTDWLGNTSNFHYDADGNPVEFDYGNGVSGAFGYDQADREISMSYSRANQSFLAFNYTRNSLGLVTNVDNGGAAGATSYSYTSVNQLGADSQSPLTYDSANNITQANQAKLSYDMANQLLNESGGIGGTSTLQYDSRGNRLQQTGPGPARTFQYDQADRLTVYGAHGAYAYNGDGLRLRKTVSGDSEAFVWNLAQNLPLLLADGKTQFIYGPKGLPLEQVAADGSVLWFHQDQQGSTRALTTQQGRVAEKYNYTAYGVRLGLGQGGDGLPTLTPLMFAGQYTDAESGLQYMRARYYDPTTGQFLTRDPVTAMTRDPYQYAKGDPVNRSDPSGLDDSIAVDPSTGNLIWGNNWGPYLNPAPAPATIDWGTATPPTPNARTEAIWNDPGPYDQVPGQMGTTRDETRASLQAVAADWGAYADKWARQAGSDLSAESAAWSSYASAWANYFAQGLANFNVYWNDGYTAWKNSIAASGPQYKFLTTGPIRPGCN